MEPALTSPAGEAASTTPVFQRKSLLRLAFPLFLLAFLSVGSSFLDQLLLSSHSPQLAAAVSMAHQILGVGYDLSGFFGIGALVVVAQLLGSGQIEKARMVSVIALVANTVLSVGIALIFFIGGEHFLAWANTPAEIAGDALRYLRIITIAMAINGFLTVAVCLLRAFGHTVEVLLFGLVGNILYLSLEYALIFGHGGFPALGVTGAALSTLVVRVLGVIFLGVLLHKRLGLSLQFLRWSGALKAKLGRLTTLSLPAVAENFAYNLYQLTMVSMIAALGLPSILSRSYVLTFTAFLSLTINALSQGNEVLVGYDKGAGHHATARGRGLRVSLGAAGVATAIAGLLYTFSDPLIRQFTDRPEVLATARTLLWINLLMQPFQASSLILLNSLRAVGDVLVPVCYSMAASWGVALPLGWLAVHHLGWGIAGLWWAMALTEGLKWTALLIRWRRMRWSERQAMA